MRRWRLAARTAARSLLALALAVPAALPALAAPEPVAPGLAALEPVSPRLAALEPVSPRLASPAPASPEPVGPAPLAVQPTAQALESLVVGDAMPRPLTDTPGDAARGRALVADRRAGLCLLCHTGPIPEERFQGSLAPDLAGSGARWSAGQLRLRVADARRLNADTIMPAYFRADGLARVGSPWAGKPIFTAQQVEDVVAYLLTLKP